MAPNALKNMVVPSKRTESPQKTSLPTPPKATTHVINFAYKTNQIMPLPLPKLDLRTNPEHQNHPKRHPGPSRDAPRKPCLFLAPPTPVPRTPWDLPRTPPGHSRTLKDHPRDVQGYPRDPRGPPKHFHTPIWGASLPAGPVPSKLNLVPTKSSSGNPKYEALDLSQTPAVVI